MYRKIVTTFLLCLVCLAGCAQNQGAIALPTNSPPPVASPTVPPTEAVIESTPSLTPAPIPEVRGPGPNDLKVLLVLAEGYGANTSLFKDIFEQHGWHITAASQRQRVGACGYFTANLLPNVQLSDVDVLEYDAVALSTSSKSQSDPFGELINSPETLALFQTADQAGIPLFGPCIGVRVFAAADILSGREVSGKGTYRDEYQNAGAVYLGGGILPVIDGNLVTSTRNLYYHVENIEAVLTAVEIQYDPETAADVQMEVETQTSLVEAPDALWTRTYGGSSAEGGRSVEVTADGGFIIAGYTYSFGHGQSDAYLVKTDQAGELLWAQSYGGPAWEYANDAAQTADGGYILAGYTTSFGVGGKDFYVVKTDPGGEVQWERTFGGPGLDIAQDVVAARDGSYLVVGYTESFGAGENDIYAVRLDAQGELVWENTYGTTGPEMGKAAVETEDGNFLLVGSSCFQAPNNDVYLVMISLEGNQLWTNTYGNSDRIEAFDRGQDVYPTSDGGFIVVGLSNASDFTSPDYMDFYITKVDRNGNQVWSSNLGRSNSYDYGNGIVEAPDGTYIAAGTAQSASGNNDIYLIQVDQEGQLVWKEAFGRKGADWGSDIALTPEGDLVVVGYTTTYGAGSYDIWLIKIDAESME